MDLLKKHSENLESNEGDQQSDEDVLKMVERLARDPKMIANKIYAKAYSKAQEQVLLKWAKLDFMEAIKSGQYAGTIIEQQYMKYGRKEYNYIITISLPDTPGAKEYEPAAHIAFNKKWIDQSKSYYVFEQRGSTKEDMGKGPHIHFKVNSFKTKPKSEIIREFSSTFKVQKNYVDVRTIHKDNGVDGYLTGTKMDPEKQLRQEFDTQWRQLLNLSHRYGSS